MQTLSCFETYHWHIIVLRNSWSNHTLWAKERLTQHTINHFFPTFLGKIRWNDQIKVLVTQLCPTLCNSKNCSPPGSSVHEIVQVRILEWIALPFSRGSSWPWEQTWVSCIAGGSFTVWPAHLAQVCPKYCTRHKNMLKYYSLFIWNLYLTGAPAFYLLSKVILLSCESPVPGGMALEADCLGLVPTLAIYKLCDLGCVT